MLQLCEQKISSPSGGGSITTNNRDMKLQKLGPGYSRMLTASKEQPDFDSLFRQSMRQEEGTKKTRNQKAVLTHRGKPATYNIAMKTKSAKKLDPIAFRDANVSQ